MTDSRQGDSRSVPGSGPSKAAAKAAAQALADRLGRGRAGYPTTYVTDALAAAHDPALGLDRSVRLGAVVEWLREFAGRYESVVLAQVADALARVFGPLNERGDGTMTTREVIMAESALKEGRTGNFDLLAFLNGLYREIERAKTHRKMVDPAYELVWLGVLAAQGGLRDALDGWPA